MPQTFHSEIDMAYHNSSTRVAAGTAPTRRPTCGRTEQQLRELYRSRGAELDALLRNEVVSLSEQCTVIPEPAQLIKDIKRGRGASMIAIGAALAAIAESPTLPERRLHVTAVRLAGWLGSLQPSGAENLESASARETLLQAHTDISQYGAIIGLRRGDVVAIDRAIGDLTSEIDAKYVLLAQLEHARRAMRAHTAVRSSVRLITGVGQPS